MDPNPHRDRRTSPVDSPDEAKTCSGINFSSWVATAAADCVALSCCPCAALSFFTLAFVKVPLMVGRKCLGRMRRKRRKIADGECDGPAAVSGGDGDDHWFIVGRDGSLRKERDEMTCFGFDDVARISARTEAERVLLELYQIGHFGFGRVSFTEIP